MSVSLLVTTRKSDSESDYMIPIATQEVFRLWWKTAAESLGLYWIPLFESGTTVARGDLPEVINELERLRQWCLSSEDLRNVILDRIDKLIDELNQISNSNDEMEVFIG
ncbi:MAG TPA: hypothetical protein VEX38_02815 [Fimbriimonadaceae bacterium]|nr:hypothetical protein [Fimbriimonadaceae bacterium]